MDGALDVATLRDRIADPVLAVRRTVALDSLPDHGEEEDPASWAATQPPAARIRSLPA